MNHSASEPIALPLSAVRSEPAPPALPLGPPFALTLGLFVLSGATGLIDQLCFSKYLGYVVGSTAHAVSAVLAAFMTGLALGAFIGGKWSLRIQRPLLGYGILELVVALAVAATPLAFSWLTPIYVALVEKAPNSLTIVSAVRWSLSMLLVIVPTTAMGATLPLLSRSLTKDSKNEDHETVRLRQRRLSALYAANTLGGASGALGAAYLVLPSLGISGTLYASAAVSALIGATAIWAGRNLHVSPTADVVSPTADVVEVSPAQTAAPSEQTDGVPGPRPSVRELGLLMLLALLSGGLVFAAEVIFTHLLALIIGNSAYAFGLILAAFLSCLFIGASRADWAQKRFGDAALPLGLSLSGLALLATLPLWSQLPWLFTGTGKVIQSFVAREATRAVAAFAILLIPTTLMGLTFPLLLQRLARYAEVGLLVGRVTAVNTLGAVVGSLLTGYFILPALGSEGSLSAVGLVFVCAGIVTAVVLDEARRKALVLGGCGLGLMLLLPSWDLVRLTSGTNVYFEGFQPPDRILFLREDVQGGVTSVTEKDGVRTLYTNGKFQGNTGWEMHAQRFFAHYPSLFVENFDRSLVIGLGTGTTLGTLAAYPWQRIDVVEISPSIVEAAGTYFTGPNRGALHDPRVELEIADGRNRLLIDSQRYNLISMELSSIWFAGASSLYSREYYHLVSEHLTPRGVFQQWVQLHHIHRPDFAAILNTLRQEFAHVLLFLGGGQGILVATQHLPQASRSRISKLSERSAIRETIPHDRTLLGLLNDVLVMDEGLDAFLNFASTEAQTELSELISTDDNLYLEYATPRGNVLPWSAREVLVSELRKFRSESAIQALVVP